MAGRGKTGDVPLGFIVILRFRVYHRVLEVCNLPDAIALDPVEEALVLAATTHG
jgi:hypothetical protein